MIVAAWRKPFGAISSGRMSSSASILFSAIPVKRMPIKPGRRPWPRPVNLSSVASGRSAMSPLLQTLLDPVFHAGERGGKPGRVGSSCLRHVGSAAAFSANLCRDMVDQVSGLDLRSQIRGDTGDERHLAAIGRTENDRSGLELGLELVERIAQRLRIGTFDRSRENARAIDLHRLR